MSPVEAETQKKAHDFLKHHALGVLSTISSDGMPWGAAIYYVVDDDFNFYFVTRAETYKYHNLDTNPVAAFTVADSESQTTVQASGQVSKVPVTEYMDVVFDKLAKIRPKHDYNWTPPIDKIHAGNFMPLRLTPTKLQYADYKHAVSGKHENHIVHIID